ncbi:amidase, partial [Burkholderia cenocepacia]|nr:amidase [Burkholderia cenocepacia]
MRSALALAAGVRSGRVSAESLVQTVLADIAARDDAINACARTFDERARRDAQRV